MKNNNSSYFIRQLFKYFLYVCSVWSETWSLVLLYKIKIRINHVSTRRTILFYSYIETVLLNIIHNNVWEKDRNYYLE